MIKTAKPGPYFPKLGNLYMNSNDITGPGLEAMLQTGMLNLIMIQVERNNIPSLLNLQLKYPTSIKVLLAQDIDVYTLDSDINP